jgi:hypothetical protein
MKAFGIPCALAMRRFAIIDVGGRHQFKTHNNTEVVPPNGRSPCR